MVILHSFSHKTHDGFDDFFGLRRYEGTFKGTRVVDRLNIAGRRGLLVNSRKTRHERGANNTKKRNVTKAIAIGSHHGRSAVVR